MGQIVGLNAKCKRANAKAINNLGVLADGEYVIISSENTMDSNEHGYFDSYIIGDGESDAKTLPIHSKEADKFYLYSGSISKNVNTTIRCSLEPGNTYYFTWKLSAAVYLNLFDSEGNKTSLLNSKSVTGPYTYEYTPTTAFSYFQVNTTVANTFLFAAKNANKSIILNTDVVDNLNDGGTYVPLSAEQGKILNNTVAVLNQYSLPLSKGGIYGTNGGTGGGDVFANARAIFQNNFDVLYIKPDYEYKLYDSDLATYTGTNHLSLVTGFTSEPYINTSSKSYFWIHVRRKDGANISNDELFNIISLEYSANDYNFKNLNNVNEYYKFGIQYIINNIEIVEGERWTNNGTIQTGSSYIRTGYIDVKGIDALKFEVATPFDAANTSTAIITVVWFDSEYNKVGFGYYVNKSNANLIIVGVPSTASFASVNGNHSSIKAFKHENNIIDSYYHNNSISAIGNLPRVSLILVYGQSLSIGSDALVITTSQKYHPLRMLYKAGVTAVNCEGDATFALLKSNVNTNAENPCYGAGEMFVESISKENGISVYSNEWERHYIVFASCGLGQKNITQLSDESAYSRVETAITNTKTLCDNFGFTMDVPAWVWIQGEQDIKAQPNEGVAAISTPNEYKEALLALHEKVCNSVFTITGSSTRPKCCLYQPASQCLYSQTYNFANSYLAFNNAYVDLLKNNNEFIASTPAYIFDGSDPNKVPPNGNKYGGFIHLDARSYKTFGAYIGYSIKKAIIDNVKVKGVIPIDISVNNTTISIKYNVPCPPLKFDTEWVKEPPLTNGVHNYGFNVVKSDNTELITSVSVFDDTVTIECSETPIGAKLRYGLNGDVYHYTNSNYNGADGRIHGGRGNLRDSQGDYVQKEIKELNQTMRLDNWAYCFEELLTEPEGE